MGADNTTLYNCTKQRYRDTEIDRDTRVRGYRDTGIQFWQQGPQESFAIGYDFLHSEFRKISMLKQTLLWHKIK